MNRLPFEIVAKAEVSQHFKKSMVISRAANVFDITRSQALLTAGCSRKLQINFAQKVVLELIHPGWREKNRFVPTRYQDIAGAELMPFRLKEIEVFLAKFVGFHKSLSVKWRFLGRFLNISVQRKNEQNTGRIQVRTALFALRFGVLASTFLVVSIKFYVWQ